MKIFMAGSTRLRYFAASTQGKHGSTRLKLFTGQLLRLRLRLPGLPRTIRSLDRSFPGTFVPGTLDLSCHGPFVHLSAEQYLVQLQRTNNVCISLNFFVPLTFYFILFVTVGLILFALKIIILRTQ